MVYTGKPSRACATCKKRRIRCDEARPACGQCVKSKRDCTGYKSETDLMFRDETTITVRRAANRRLPISPAASIRSSSPEDTIDLPSGYDVIDFGDSPLFTSTSFGNSSTSSPDDFSFYSSSFQPSPLPLTLSTPQPQYALANNVNERAKAYFFHHFALFGIEHTFHLYYIIADLYKKAAEDDPIKVTTDAFSLLTLSRRRGEGRVMIEAAKAYAKAARAVAAALSDPVRINENGTLLSVIILSWAETMDVTTASHPGFVPRYSLMPQEKGIAKFHHAWGSHTTGAELIVQKRGVEDMSQSAASGQIASFVRMQVVHKNIWIAKPIDEREELWNRMDDIHRGLGNYSPHFDLCTIALGVPKLRAAGLAACRKPMEPGLGQELQQLLSEARSVDAELFNWSITQAGGSWIAGYNINPLPEDLSKAPAWSGAVWGYKGIRFMNPHNSCRSYRLCAQVLIFNLLERLIPPDQLQSHPDFVTCKQTIEQMVDEICGSVPWALGYLEHLPLSPTPVASSLGTSITHSTTPDFIESWQGAEAFAPSLDHTDPEFEEDTGPTVGAWYLVWALYCCYCMIVIPDRQRHWIRMRLKHIGDRYGIMQALLYQKGERTSYVPGERRRFTPVDFSPPPWEPLQ